MEAIVASVRKQSLNLSTGPRSLDIATYPGDVELFVDVYEQPVRRLPYCEDHLMMPLPPKERWKAISGRITIELTAPGVSSIWPSHYRATISIVGAEFVSPSGTRIRQTTPIRLTGLAGWGVG
jgi:hypothetical protein